jgi:hypothetical protein
MTEKRWKNRPNEMPGPADYELSPMFQDTLLKGTFNATLNNPLVLKRQKETILESNVDTNKTFGVNSEFLRVA